MHASARLHLGFLDPNATLGRRFGSLGLALRDIVTTVRVERADALHVAGTQVDRAAEIIHRLANHFEQESTLAVTLERTIPPHAGLGSGTQLALALGHALARYWRVEVDTREIARLLGRGRRSGIGLAVFDKGGLVVDGGHGSATTVPPLLSHHDMPEKWRAILVFDRNCEGISGEVEKEAFGQLPPFTHNQAAELCHQTLMRVLPAVAEGDFELFCAGLGTIQALIGDHFSAVQDGRFTSTAVGRVIDYCQQALGYRGAGQSSWGPTGFVFVPDEKTAVDLLTTLQRRFASESGLEIVAISPNNEPAQIVVQAAAERVALKS